MHYYEVLPADPGYVDYSRLTYQSELVIEPLTIVKVTLKNKVTIALVIKQTTRPSFKTKQIKQVSKFTLPKNHKNLFAWLATYYPGSSGKLLSLFMPNYLRLDEDIPQLDISIPATLQQLNTNQKNIVNSILDSPRLLHLLHGDTGSGKTRVHLQLAYSMLAQNKSVLLLTPEIGLAPQLLQLAQETFANRCLVFHSGMTSKERRIVWATIQASKEPLVIVGTRSALFLPFNSLGLVVVDEFHDSSYKQDQSPYYQTSRVVAKIAALWDSKVLFSSATPRVSDYYTFKQNNLPIYRLKGVAISHNYTDTITVLDKTDSSLFTQSRLLTTKAVESLRQNYKSNRQTLIFHNRRGTARIILCNQCGWQQLCPKCDINMTYHADRHHVLCHSCGLHSSAPTYCADCKNPDVLFKSEGTKALEAEVKKLLPNATVARFDGDNTKRESLDSQYHSIVSNEVSVIIGTQMITKGLDLPHLRTVVVVAAENQLLFPDFSANEKAFQQISQVIGRAKRGHQETEVIIQSMNPGGLVLGQAIKTDYDSFYATEIAHRKQYNFPPFTYMLILKIGRKTATGTKKAAAALHSLLLKHAEGLEISDPHPSFREKVNNQFRWQIVIKSTNRKRLLTIIKLVPSATTYDIDPIDLL